MSALHVSWQLEEKWNLREASLSLLFPVYGETILPPHEVHAQPWPAPDLLTRETSSRSLCCRQSQGTRV